MELFLAIGDTIAISGAKLRKVWEIKIGLLNGCINFQELEGPIMRALVSTLP